MAVPGETVVSAPKGLEDIVDIFASDDKSESKDKDKPVKEAVKDDEPVKEPKAKEEIKDDSNEDEDKIDIETDEDDSDLDDSDKIKLDEKLLKDTKEEEESIKIDDPPKKREILKVYPDFFKKFPNIEAVIYRDKAIKEQFGSFDDIKEAFEAKGILSNFEADLGKGNTEKLLKQIKENDSKAFDSLVDNYLGTLRKVDPEAFTDVVHNLSKQMIYQMAVEGRDTDNEDLRKAAVQLNRWIFKRDDLTDMKVRSSNKTKEDDPAKLKLDEREQKIQEREFTRAKGEVQTKIDNVLKDAISTYIDPKGEMSPYVKKTASKEALDNVYELINSDKEFKSKFNNLWKEAIDDEFSGDKLKKIISSFLFKGRGALPTAIKKARAEAIKGSTAQKSNEETEDKTPVKGKNLPTGRPRNEGQSRLEMKKGESITDFLMRDN